MAKRVIISASPRAMGKCARAANDLSKAFSTAYPTDEVDVIRLPDLDIHYCTGCNVCEADHECFMEDGMQTVLAALETADALYIISPIYFAGPPANYKAMLDRFQPFFWTWEKGQPKRPAELIALGDGGDPNGYEPLETCTRSALAVAGFKLLSTWAFIDASSAVISAGMNHIAYPLPDEA